MANWIVCTFTKTVGFSNQSSLFKHPSKTLESLEWNTHSYRNLLMSHEDTDTEELCPCLLRHHRKHLDIGQFCLLRLLHVSLQYHMLQCDPNTHHLESRDKSERKQNLYWTSKLMRLNSSKQHQAPEEAMPLKNLPIALQNANHANRKEPIGISLRIFKDCSVPKPSSVRHSQDHLSS